MTWTLAAILTAAICWIFYLQRTPKRQERPRATTDYATEHVVARSARRRAEATVSASVGGAETDSGGDADAYQVPPCVPLVVWHGYVINGKRRRTVTH